MIWNEDGVFAIWTEDVRGVFMNWNDGSGRWIEFVKNQSLLVSMESVKTRDRKRHQSCPVSRQRLHPVSLIFRTVLAKPDGWRFCALLCNFFELAIQDMEGWQYAKKPQDWGFLCHHQGTVHIDLEVG
uniref:Uncharacterized protein n=1 Tax=Peronospora matthiolae TaxID=2874970 RepID=A0AAV1U4C4_9STRA